MTCVEAMTDGHNHNGQPQQWWTMDDNAKTMTTDNNMMHEGSASKTGQEIPLCSFIHI